MKRFNKLFYLLLVMAGFYLTSYGQVQGKLADTLETNGACANWPQRIHARPITKKDFDAAKERASSFPTELPHWYPEIDEAALLAEDENAHRYGDSLVFYHSNGEKTIIVDEHGEFEGYFRSQYIASYPAVRQWLVLYQRSNSVAFGLLDFDKAETERAYGYPYFNCDSTLFVTFRHENSEFAPNGLNIWLVRNNKAYLVRDYNLSDTHTGFSDVVWDGNNLLFKYASLKEGHYFWGHDSEHHHCYGFIKHTPLQFSTESQYINDSYGTFTDVRDGQVYHWVRIGDQVWMAENLNYAADDSKCYDNKEEFCKAYGRLYTWDTAMNGEAKSFENPSGVQGICPPGWHLPSFDEWQTLFHLMNSLNYDGNALKTCRQVNSPFGGICNTLKHPRWHPDLIHHGMDSFGFKAVPGGRKYKNGDFMGLGVEAYYWASSAIFYGRAYSRSIVISGRLAFIQDTRRTKYFSIRCIKD